MPLPPDEGRPAAWLGESLEQSPFGDGTEEPHGLDADEDGRLPQLWLPLTESKYK